MSDSEPATIRSTSRRRLLQGVTACGLPIPPLSGAGDPGRMIAERYCALEQEQRSLYLAWQGVETWLFKHRNWPRLTKSEQAAVPEAAQFRVIEDQLEAIDKEYDALLPLLKKTSAHTREGLVARLDALLWLLNPYDNADAYVLLQSCQRDLKRIWL